LCTKVNNSYFGKSETASQKEVIFFLILKKLRELAKGRWEPGKKSALDREEAPARTMTVLG
jgi:hypothetical protein